MRQRGGKSYPASGADFVGQFEVPPLAGMGGVSEGLKKNAVKDSEKWTITADFGGEKNS